VFVNLPADKRHAAPDAFHLPAHKIPRIQDDRANARLVLGESHGLVGASAPDIPLTLLDIDIQSDGRFTHHGDADQHAWALAIAGMSTVSWNAASVELSAGTAVAVTGATDIAISSDAGAQVVLFRGSPLRQAFVQRGPFVMGSAAEIDAVEADYRSGRLGSID
jgi:redox-sensitive bicupin YhaK (pirin superfamily)